MKKDLYPKEVLAFEENLKEKGELFKEITKLSKRRIMKQSNERHE